MERKTSAHLVWSPAAYWCRVWQAQFELGLRMWGAWASALPRPAAKDLSDEAEALRSATPPRSARRPAAASPRPARKTQPGSRALR